MTSNITAADGSELQPDHRDLKENGQQKQYAVLSAEERAKGFVRPYRDSYVHVGDNPDIVNGVIRKYGDGGCGTLTRMGRTIAETYARDPKFYTGTFCVGCGAHLTLSQFMWDKTTEIVGS